MKNSTSALVCLSLIAATLIVFWRAGSCDFINYDDPGYVYDNPRVTSGLSADNLTWAFTTTAMSNWHPVTWLSHMTDSQIHGRNPGGHHLTSVFLHTLNTLLLFLLLWKMTGAPWQSAMVAALFSLHPLHVESVVWISERKDVLSGTFFLLTLLAYRRFTARRSLPAYITAVCFFALGLMAKPMIVMLPLVLLLLDFWPLGRLGTSSGRCGNWRSIFLEKVPFFLLALCSGTITWIAQQRGGAVVRLEDFPLISRLLQVPVSYATYLLKSVWPHDLAVFYPLRMQLPIWQVTGATLLLGIITFLAARKRRKQPFLLFGWMWFLLVPMPAIGVIKVGLLATADRYTYLSLIGLFIMVCWGVPELVKEWRYREKVLAVLGGAWVVALAAAAFVQIGYWENSITLFSRTLQVTKNNFTVHNNLGVALAESGRPLEAIIQYGEAIRIEPRFAEAHYNLGFELDTLGRLPEAIPHYQEAVRLNPLDSEALERLANDLDKVGRVEEARLHRAEAERRSRQALNRSRSN